MIFPVEDKYYSAFAGGL